MRRMRQEVSGRDGSSRCTAATIARVKNALLQRLHEVDF